MNAADLVLRQGLAIFFIDEDAMGGKNIGAEKANGLKILHRACSVLLLAVLPFLLHFCDVNENRGMVFASQARCVVERFSRAGVDGMRGDGRMDERIALPL